MYAKSGSKIWLAPVVGYANGIGGGAELSFLNAIPSFPLGFHFSVGYFHQSEPGVAVDARKIFINDATAGNDNILEYGYNVFFRFDFSYPVYEQKGMDISAYLGVAHARYIAHFNYQGGNEAFDISSNPWGLGFGARANFSLSPSLMIIANAGFEYYFPDRISAHGNFYNPDATDDNPRAPYVYSDADGAIEQPVFIPRITLAIAFRL